MPINFTVDDLSGVPSNLHSLYRKEGEGYVLEVEGMEDTGALRRALDHVKRERDDAKRERDALRTDKTKAEHDALVATGNVADITKSYEDKIKAMENAEKERNKAFENKVKATAMGEVATKLASEISTVPSLMRNVIKDRLYVDMVDGEAIVRVRDPLGKPSASSVAELKQELLANPEYKSILIATRASGGGATGNGDGGGAGSASVKLLKDMSEKERIAWFKSDPAAFRAARDTEKTA